MSPGPVFVVVCSVLICGAFLCVYWVLHQMRRCECGVAQNDGLLVFFPAKRLVRRKNFLALGKGGDHEGSDDTTVPGEETAHDAG